MFKLRFKNRGFFNLLNKYLKFYKSTSIEYESTASLTRRFFLIFFYLFIFIFIFLTFILYIRSLINRLFSCFIFLISIYSFWLFNFHASYVDTWLGNDLKGNHKMKPNYITTTPKSSPFSPSDTIPMYKFNSNIKHSNSLIFITYINNFITDPMIPLNLVYTITQCLQL